MSAEESRNKKAYKKSGLWHRRGPVYPPGGRLYTMREICDWAGVSYAVLYRLVRSGKLRAIRFSGQWRVHEHDLAAFLRERGLDLDALKDSNTEEKPEERHAAEA